MLVGSVGTTASSEADQDLAERAQADLDRWLRHVGRYGRQPGEDDLPLTQEIAVAQGFKYAANRRPAYPDTRHEARMNLAEQALEMLKVHRILVLPADPHPGAVPAEPVRPAQTSRRPGRRQARSDRPALARRRRPREHGPRPASGRPGEQHPLVQEAAQLAVLALKTGSPQRYLWIDESGVVGQVGSRKTSEGAAYRKHRLWIPPSAGWTALNGRAQQLVADVLLLLNLADRGDLAKDSERRLKRSNRYDLPPCITRYRHALEPGLTVGTAASAAPGTSCVDGCAFELCPYPPKGSQPRGR